MPRARNFGPSGVAGHLPKVLSRELRAYVVDADGISWEAAPEQFASLSGENPFMLNSLLPRWEFRTTEGTAVRGQLFFFEDALKEVFREFPEGTTVKIIASWLQEGFESRPHGLTNNQLIRRAKREIPGLRSCGLRTMQNAKRMAFGRK